VAARKAAGLLECGAQVVVVAPEVDPAIDAMAVTVERREYQPGMAAAYRLVVTATGVPEVDAAVAEDAERAGIWVNSADDPAHCTFILPAVHRDGPVTIAVSTGGNSPTLAVWLRNELARDAGPGIGHLADLLGEARRRMRAEGRSTESVDWAGLLDGQLTELVRAGDLDAARDLLDRAVG
jgi:siroheme synthase-like protein